MSYSDIVTLLCPESEPIESSYLWSKFAVTASQDEDVPLIDGCPFVYYCVNASIAAEILVNQIKPTITEGSGYFVVFPISDTVEVAGTRSVINATFTVVHYGWYDSHKSEAIARTHVTQLMENYRTAQQQYISNIRINNTNFSEWADDNSPIQQYTAVVTVRAVEPYALSSQCK